MQEKMIRFLSSIHIDNIDDFDMDFDAIVRNRFKPNEWNMQIYKQTPWEYELLRTFQDGLNTINSYTYTIHFSYAQNPSVEDALKLLPDWYQTIYHLPLPYEVMKKEDDNSIHFIFESNEQALNAETVLKDFKDFLDFLSYDFLLTSEVRQDEVISVSTRKLNKALKQASNLANQAIAEEEKNTDLLHPSQISVMQEIEKEHSLMTQSVESEMIEQMKENAELMKIEIP